MKNFVQLETDETLWFDISKISHVVGCDHTCFGNNDTYTSLIHAETLLPQMKSMGYRLLNVSSTYDSQRDYVHHYFNFVLK